MTRINDHQVIQLLPISGDLVFADDSSGYEVALSLDFCVTHMEELTKTRDLYGDDDVFGFSDGPLHGVTENYVEFQYRDFLRVYDAIVYFALQAVADSLDL